MSDVAHRILETTTGPFYLRRAADDSIATGWMAMLDANTRTRFRAAADRLAGVDDGLEDLAARIGVAMDGGAVRFDDVPPPTGTPFQRAVWRGARSIRPGETMTYGSLAAMIGRPQAARAVGQAMRRNPQPILTPCHRVIATGSIGGFGGQNADGTHASLKRILLDRERETRRRISPARSSER